MRSFEELLAESRSNHGHHCAGQALGVRMAMAGCREVGIDEPKGCKKLVVVVEMDRCATDAVQAVTGCSLGKRTLKFLDYGKMAATFVNLETHQAVRILARDDARSWAYQYAPNAVNPQDAQKQAYAVMPEEKLFSISAATADIPEANLPGFRAPRVQCEVCGEGINLRREVHRDGRTLCIPCARESQSARPEPGAVPKVILIVGYKKVGKTALIESLIPELSRRGYRVATVKHHHGNHPIAVDSCGSDTWRHRRAGAKTTVLVTPVNITVFRDTDDTGPLDQIIASVTATDIILAEGFNQSPYPKIEVLSDENEETRCAKDANLLALVGRANQEQGIPSFARGSIKPLTDLIEARLFEPGFRSRDVNF